MTKRMLPLFVLCGSALIAVSTAQSSPGTSALDSLQAQVGKVSHNSPIYSEVIPTQFVPPTPGPNDWKKEFTAPNGKLVTVLVQAPRGTGVYSRPIGNGETPDEYFPSVVSEAIARGAHKIVIPYGTYNFKGPAMTETGPCTVNTWPLCTPNTHWTIGNYLGFGPTIEDLDIDGSGSTLNFNAPLTGIQMYNVRRIRFHNFTLDWPNAPVAALGTIVLDPTNPGHNAVVIDNSFPVSATNPNFTVKGYPQIQAINTWDGDDWTGHFNSLAGNNIPSDEVYFLWTPSDNLPIYVGKTSAGDQTYSCQDCNFIKSKNPNDCSYYANCANFDYFRLGARVVVRYLTYNGWAINVSFSDDVDFDHLTVLSSPGNGINFGTGGGYRGARVADSIFTRAPGRPVSVASGPVNLSQFTGDIIFENDVIAYQGDDGINIASWTTNINRVENLSAHGGTVLTAYVWDGNPKDYATTGDWIAFFDENQDYLDSARVTSVPGCTISNPVCTQFSFGPCSSGDCSATLSLLNTLNGQGNFADLTRQSAARFVVSRNYIHDCRCHSIVTSSPYGLINRNNFVDNSAGNINLFAGAGNGFGSSNVIIRNNILTQSGKANASGMFALALSAANVTFPTTPIFQNIIISGNTIRRSQGPGIFVDGAAEIYVRNNTIDDSNADAQNDVDWGSLTTLDSIMMLDMNNGTVCGTTLTGTSGPIGVDPSATNVTVSPACP
jgi:parallel beta-helix repeat protein